MTAATVPDMVLLTAPEAAEILGVTVHTVHQMASEGQLQRHALPHVRRTYDHDDSKPGPWRD